MLKWIDIDPKVHGWYEKYSWTKEQENLFIDWAVDYLLNSKDARKEILQYETKSKAKIESAILSFVRGYGWKYTVGTVSSDLIHDYYL